MVNPSGYTENRVRPKLSTDGFDKLSQRSLSLSMVAKVLISNYFQYKTGD